MLMAVPGWLLLGWLVARFHRGTFVFGYLFATWLLVGVDYSRQLSNALAEARFRPYFVAQTVSQILFALSVVAGALSSRKADAIR